MTEQVFLKAEYVTTEVKEECDEENYELFTETLNAKGESSDRARGITVTIYLVNIRQLLNI